MNKLIYSFLLAILTISFATAQNLPVDAKTGKITYLKVVDAKGMKSKDLYTAAKDWGTSKGFKIKKEDEATGELVFEASLPAEYPGVKGKTEKGNVNYNLYVFAKDDKYRYILTDFVHAGVDNAPDGGKLESNTPACGAAGMTSATWVLIKKKTQSGMEALTADLERVIKEIQNDPTKNSDW